MLVLGLGPGLKDQVLGPGLGLEGQVLVNITANDRPTDRRPTSGPGLFTRWKTSNGHNSTTVIRSPHVWF